MPDVLFHGGPCDGLHTLVDDKEIVGGKITCNEVVYDVTEVTPGEWLALSTEPAAPPAETAVPLDGGVTAAWRGLTRAIGVTVPRSINAARRDRRRIRAAGRR